MGEINTRWHGIIYHTKIFSTYNQGCLRHKVCYHTIIPLWRRKLTFVIVLATGGTAGCRCNNPRCHKWRQSWHHGTVSNGEVTIINMIMGHFTDIWRGNLSGLNGRLIAVDMKLHIVQKYFSGIFRSTSAIKSVITQWYNPVMTANSWKRGVALLLIQLSRHWRHLRFYDQLAVQPMTTKLASWQLSGFNEYCPI